ncbi:unnamed protein product [Didymodactylos carnosus]|uniref:Uncharacterized protein n=1 Tax=Didymodactylos carnosus TaxID=1234261 RepID=A0A813RXJ2_9BILA|nr:unnamed protein product [Didymodactylos carnosus]CAF3572300.1 unnamed protein product [Didymodactylos carnosus]
MQHATGSMLTHGERRHQQTDARSAVINPSVFPRVLSKNIACIGTISYPSSRLIASLEKDRESDYEAPKSVCDDIDKLVTSLDNRVESEKVIMLLRRYAKIFDTTKPSVTDTTTKHVIDLEEGGRPATAAYYRQNPKNNEIIDETVKQLLQGDRAERSYSA